MGGVQQRLLNAGEADAGIVVFEGFDPEIIEKAYRPFDNLSVSVTLISTGSIKKEVLGSVVESLTIADDERATEIFENPSLMMASFTITEKGYAPAFAEKDHWMLLEFMPDGDPASLKTEAQSLRKLTESK